ncbi:hypothetical protein BBB39_16235 [Bordetella trematum]|nr:hypothetical protein BBB39_16235 [Bordetella trematum]
MIRGYGYGSPECVIARLHQWIGLHGGKNNVTLLMYEAHKALVKLRTPVADERAAFTAWLAGSYPSVYSEPEAVRLWHHGHVAALAWQERGRRAALASAPVAKPCPVEEQPDGTVTPVDPVDMASAPVAGEAIQKAKHDTANAETERERVMALAYWLDQQTFEPGMLSCAAATLRAMFDRYAVNELVAAEYNRWIRAHAAGQSYDTFLIAELAAQQGEGGGV